MSPLRFLGPICVAICLVVTLVSPAAAQPMFFGGYGFQNGLGTGGSVTPAAFLPTASVTAQGVWSPILLVSGYSGPLFTLRRQSDNATMNVSASGGTTPTTFAGQLPNYATIDAWDGGVDPAITEVYDQTGAGNHLTQATSTLQPLLSSLWTSNGVRPIQFDWSYLPLVVSWMSLPSGVTINSRNTGTLMAIDMRSTGKTSSITEVYSGSTGGTIVQTLFTIAGIAANPPIFEFNPPPRAMPSSVFYAADGTSRRYTARGVTETGSLATAGTSNVAGYVGNSTSGSTDPSYYDFYALVNYASTPTTGDISTVSAGTDSIFAFPTTGFTKRLVYNGSSLNAGYGSTRNQAPLKVMNLGNTWEQFNMAVPGAQLSAEYTGRAKDLALYSSTMRTVFTIDAPSNDISAQTFASQAAAIAYADTLYSGTTVPYVQALLAAGPNARVVVPTMIARGSVTIANFQEYARLEYNTDVRNGAVTNNYFLSDRCSYAPFNTVPTTANYVSDLIHANDNGYQAAGAFASVEKAAITAAGV